MADIPSTFQDLNRECAKSFLQHAVVVDNGLYLRDEERVLAETRAVAAATPLETPGPRRKKQSVKIEEKLTAEKLEPRDLNARKLVDKFADLGIICSPYCPDSTAEIEEVSDRTVRVAQHADIVVIDWDLGGGNDKVIETIKKIRRHDQRKGGRLRLIAVYTGEKDINSLYETLQTELGLNDVKAIPDVQDGQEENNQTELEYLIEFDDCRIVFFNKSFVSEPLEGVQALSEDELPDALVTEFARMTDGLMPNVALSAISAVRAATHHILAKFDGTLDSALLTHRTMLIDPEEAEHFAVQLVADEITSILEASEIGAKQFGADPIKLWIYDKALNSGLKFGLSNPLEDKFSKNEVEKFIDIGSANLKEIKDKNGNNPSSKNFDKGAHNLFTHSEDERDQAHRRVSRYSTTKREAFGNPYLPSDWSPQLTLGTVVARTPEGTNPRYYICIQPVCDSVRVEDAGRQFPFLTMKAVECDAKHDLVLRSPSGDDLFLKINYQAHKQALLTFKPEVGTNTISAKKTGGRFRFQSASKINYYWIADLKNVVAIRDADRISASVRRVGMDEFEWLRKKSPNS